MSNISLELKIKKKINDQYYYQKIIDHLRKNHEFKLFLKSTYQFFKNFEFLNDFQFKIEKYFISFDISNDINIKECQQEIKNYRFILSRNEKHLFLKLKKCHHELPYKALLKKNYLYYDFHKKLIDENLIDYLIQPKDIATKELIKNFKNFLENKKITSSLFISGNSKTEKIFLTVLFINKFIKKTNIKVIFINSSNLLEMFQNKGNSLLKKIKIIDLLVINELGLESQNYEFRDGFLFPLIKKRYNNDLPTFLISNFNLENISKYYTYGKPKYYSEKIKCESFFDFINKVYKICELK